LYVVITGVNVYIKGGANFSMVYIYIYIYIYTHTHTHIYFEVGALNAFNFHCVI